MAPHRYLPHVPLPSFTPTLQVFQDYLIPSLSLLPNDVEEAVRVEYALGIAQLAAAAHKHLMRLQQQVNREALGAAAAAALGDVQGMAGAVQPFRCAGAGGEGKGGEAPAEAAAGSNPEVQTNS